MLRTRDGRTAQATATGPRKRDAEQASNGAAFGHLFGVTSIERSATPADDPSQETSLAPGEEVANPKGGLLELRQQQGWKPPVFSVTSEGPSNAPTFACKVRLALPGEVLKAAAPSASTKKEAEARADLRLLPQARDHASTARLQASTGSPNPIGMLQESAQ